MLPALALHYILPELLNLGKIANNPGNDAYQAYGSVLQFCLWKSLQGVLSII
jgi:hypothetical protein